MKHFFDGLNDDYTAVWRISEMKERCTGMNDQTETQRKKNGKKEWSPQELWDDTGQRTGIQ